MNRARTRALVLVAFATLAAAPAEARKIDVGGHRLHVIRKGDGEPVVVFDSGMGDSLETWRWVWPEVARMTSVLLYDRAGLGRSDPGPLPRTSARIAEELEALLDAVRVRGPVILVGHSFGGLNARLFAATRPARVAGLVLIDPTPVDFPARESSLRDEVERRKIETLMQLTGEGPRQERQAVAESAEQVRRAGPIPAELPVVVLSSARQTESAPFRDAWRALQVELAREVGADSHMVEDAAGHYIQYDAPDLVVDAIRRVLDGIRRRGDPAAGPVSGEPRHAPTPPRAPFPDRP